MSELNKFINCLSRFNKDDPLSDNIVKKIENYFNYRWQHYKAFVFQREFENVWINMPESSIDLLKSSLMFKDFLNIYSQVLMFPKKTKN